MNDMFCFQCEQTAGGKGCTKVGVCGNMAADPVAAPILVGLGVDELSVSIPNVAALKAQIRGLSRNEAERLARTALNCATAAEVRALPVAREMAHAA